MIVEQSSALKFFKREVGQANHMLITLIVGLDGIVAHDIEPSADFHVSWNPKNKTASVERGKVFAKKSSLAWVVDCFDIYLRTINQKPALIQNLDLKYKIDLEDNSRSIYKRTNIICNHYEISTISYAIFDLLICWRNRLIHYSANNDILEGNRSILRKSTDIIAEQYCGLDIESTLESFKQGHIPTFKEVASLMKSTIELAYEIDNKLIEDLDLIVFADQLLVKYFKDNSESRLNHIFSKSQQTKQKSLKQILIQNGFCDKNKNEVDEFCVRVSDINHAEAKIKMEIGSFV